MTLLKELVSPGVLCLTLDRPAQRNALDAAMVEHLTEAIGEVREGVVVISSSNDRAFCSGLDLATPVRQRPRVSDQLYGLYATMIDSPAVIIAACPGHVVGGGAQLALASDMRIGSPTTTFRFAGPGHGLAVGAWALPSLVGRGRAIDLCLTMRPVGAREAIAMGLLDRLVDDAQSEALAVGSDIAVLEPAAMRRVKQLSVQSGRLHQLLAAERVGNQTWRGEIPPKPSPGPGT